MDVKKLFLLEAVRRRALQEIGRLAGRLARARAPDKEGILAALEFERWFAESCEAALTRASEAGSGAL